LAPGKANVEVADLSDVGVRRLLKVSDLNKVDRGQSALRLPPDDDGAVGLVIQPREVKAVDDHEEAALCYAVDSAERGLAVLPEAPAPGIKRATIGAAELFGAEFGLEK